jgi:hypothetical protein
LHWNEVKTRQPNSVIALKMSFRTIPLFQKNSVLWKIAFESLKVTAALSLKIDTLWFSIISSTISISKQQTANSKQQLGIRNSYFRTIALGTFPELHSELRSAQHSLAIQGFAPRHACTRINMTP